MTWITYVWTCVIIMFVVSVNAGTVKRPASNPMTQWVFIPKEAKRNETWIPVPYNVLEKSNMSQHFKLIRMYVNGILTNETLYPIHEDESRKESVPVIIYGCFLLIIVIGGWIIFFFKLMQKQQRHQNK